MTDDLVPRSSPSEESVSTSILDRARYGDQDAFRMITQLYAGLVYHWIRKKGLSPEHAEDISQQVFMAVSQNLVTFRRQKPADSFRAWLRIITRSKIIDHLRKNAGVETAAGGDQLWNKVSAIDCEEDSNQDAAILYQKAIQFVRGEFAERDCSAFLMLVVDGHAAKDVAEMLGTSVNSVYIAKSRILRRLQIEFAELLDDNTH